MACYSCRLGRMTGVESLWLFKYNNSCTDCLFMCVYQVCGIRMQWQIDMIIDMRQYFYLEPTESLPMNFCRIGIKKSFKEIKILVSFPKQRFIFLFFYTFHHTMRKREIRALWIISLNAKMCKMFVLRI